MKLLNLTNWVQNLVEAFTFYSGGGGGGSQTSTGTTYTSNLPEYAKPFFEQAMVESAKNVFTTGPGGEVTGIKPMPTYTGERVAGFTPGQEAIQRETMGLALPDQFGQSKTGLTTGQAMGFGAGAAGLTGALGYSPTAISGGTFGAPDAAAYMSPYQSNVTDIAVREAERKAAMDKSAGALGSIGRGTFGGARQALLQAEQGRNAMQTIGDIRAKGQQEAFVNAQTQFERDQARRMQAAQLGQQAQQFQAGLGKDIGLAGMMAGIDTSGKLGALGTAEQTANLERLKAQAATEGEKQALQQQINDMKYQQFQEQKDFQKNQLEYLSAILRGNAGALGSTQVQYTPQPSTASQIASLGLSGLALSKALG